MEKQIKSVNKKKDKMIKPNNKYLNNGYFYLSCNACDRLILKTEMTEEEYQNYYGYCPKCHLEAISK